MAFNPTGAAPVPLTVFGGRVSESAPPNLPEGVSPDCGDLVFTPGSVASRPAVHKVFATPFAQGTAAFTPTVTGGQTYIAPDGNVYNIYLDSNGILWVENVSSAPGISVNLGQFAPNSYLKSVTAFGRQYIAISDALHGSDIPLQLVASAAGLYLDRVTQDAPGAPPSVSSIALPSVAMVATGVPPTISITEADPAGGGAGGPYGQINFWTSDASPQIAVGNLVSITGTSGASSAVFNAIVDAPVVAVYTGGGGSFKTLIVLQAFLPAGTTFVTGGTATLGSGITMSRSNNVVTVSTTDPHQLQVGYLAQITGVPAQAVGTSIVSIVIDNEDFPGLATVTTTDPHGLTPGTFVSIPAVIGTAIGGGVSTSVIAGGITNITTATAHGLTPGAIVTLAGSSAADANVTASVAQVGSPTQFTILQPGAADASGAGGTATLQWPVGQSATPNYYEVVETPTATTFTIEINYVDGSWTGSGPNLAWNGQFFVTAVLDPFTFTYQQYGPDATTTTVGTVTPYGQAAPGIHQCAVAFLTRNGAITAYSPPVQFVANGGQYVSVSNIPIGPPNVIGRILLFTSAMGAYFYYIPVPAQVNGQVVSSSTQINDNTSTSAFLDFSDTTLLSAIGVSIPGNDLAAQIVLDGALGFGFYASRLMTWGQRNRINNFLNMGFDGGQLPMNTLPLGWTTALNVGGSITAGHFGEGWSVNVTFPGTFGQITQPMYEDYLGDPIATGNTLYTFRAWIKTNVNLSVNVIAQIHSATTTFTSLATITGASVNGAFFQADFASVTPASIPTDLKLTIYCTSTNTVTVLIDEMSIIYAEDPFNDAFMMASYPNNPEGFDGVTGLLGSTDDTNKIMDMAEIRNTLYIVTQDPGGSLHETADNGVTEPSGWSFEKVASNCGLLSAFALTKNQANSGTASGGEQWLAWGSQTGARIFGGGQVRKISQEIEPDWAGAQTAGASQWSTATGIGNLAQLSTWALNDPEARVVYFGLPLWPTGTPGTPTQIWTMNYREMDTAEEIAAAAPIHTSYTGRLIATDHTRKWCPWNLTMNGAALMYRAPGQIQPVFFAGNGQPLGTANGFANVYTLNSAMLTDDDFGQINPFYFTYAFVTHDQEQQLSYDQPTPQGIQKMPLGPGRKLVSYVTAFIPGTGNITITPYPDALTNPWSLVGVRTMTATPTFDLEWGGGSAQGQRIFFKIASSPPTGSDNGFSLQHLVVWMKRARLQIRGSAT